MTHAPRAIVKDALAAKDRNLRDPKYLTQRAIREVHAKFAAHADEALVVLLEIMQDDTAKDPDRMNAAKAILDRGLGTPVQTTNLNLASGNESGLDAEKIAKLDDGQLAEIHEMLLKIADTNAGDMIDISSEDENES